MRLTDGKRTVQIEMRTWTGSNLTPDWSEDFFNAGLLQRNPDTDAYCVNDVDYCIEQANDWANQEGDYRDDGLPPAEDRIVIVTEEV